MTSRQLSASSPDWSRRSVLRASALGLGVAVGGAVLGACSASGPVDLPTAAATGMPVRGGRLRIARPAASQAETLDPASALSAYEYLGAIYNRLVRLDEAGLPVPELVADWSVSADAMRWTFRMRDGVDFHDGRRLTASDAAYTLRHILDPDVGSPQAGVLGTVMDADGIRATDSTTLTIDLTNPHADLPSLLTAYQCYVIPDDSAGEIGTTGIGTGPFQLSSFRAAGRGSIESFPDHFGGAPVLDGIDFFSIADTQARVNALLADQIDLISQTNLDFATARVVEASSRTTIARVANGQWYAIPLLADSAEFSDVRVRRALKHAYDPAHVLASAAQGEGTIGNDNPITPNDAAHLDHRVERDVDRARALLAEAGYPDGFQMELHTSSYDPIFTPMAVAFAESVREAGIDVQVRNASADSYYTQIWMQEPAMATYWYTGRPVDQLLNQIFRGGSSYNESRWSNPQFDGLLDAARAEINADRRRMLYQDAQRLIVDDGATLTPMFADRLVGISTEVLNYHEYGFEMDYRNIGLRGER